MLQAEFFFDFSCPWSYLACVRLREAAMRTGARILWRPFDLKDLRAEFGDRSARLAGDAATGAWQLQDLEDWARYCDLPLQLPDNWPQSTRAALVATLVAIDAGQADAFILNVFRAIYGEGLDVEDMGILRTLAEGAGLGVAELEAAVADESGAARLVSNARDLQSRGGFRSATLFVGDKMFCGNSRMPLVEFALAQASGRQFVMPGQHS